MEYFSCIFRYTQIYPCLGCTTLSPEMPESVSAKAVCGGVDTRRVLTGRAIDSVATSQDVSGRWIWVMGSNLCSFSGN